MTKQTDTARQAAASIRKRLALLKDDPQKWLAMIEEEIGYAMAAETAALQAENERLRERCEDADAAMESLKSLLDPSMPETLLGAVGYMIDHSNTGWMKVGELRKRCEELVAELKRSVAIYEQAGENARIQVDTALASLCEATGVEFEGVTLKQILDKIKQLTAERDALRKKTIDLEGMLATAHEAAAKAMAERDEAREELEPLNLARQFKPDPHTIGAQDEKTILAVRVLNYLDMTLADELDEEVAAIQKQLRRAVAERDAANQRTERTEAKLEELQRSGDKKGSTL